MVFSSYGSANRGRTRYFQEKGNSVCRRARSVPCVPCFIFPKVSWSVSNRSFPVLTVFPLWMTDVSSAAHIRYQARTSVEGRTDEYSLYKTPCNRFVRWSRFGVFNKIFTELANKTPFDGSLMIDSIHLNVHRTAASCSKRGFSTSHWMNKRWPKFHIVCDGHGRPILLLLPEGQISDYKGAAILQHFLPNNSTFLAGGGV